VRSWNRVGLMGCALLVPGVLLAGGTDPSGLDEQCAALTGEYDGLTGALAVLDKRLDKMLSEVDAAPAPEKARHLAQVVREMVAERHDLTDGMVRLQLRMALFVAQGGAKPGAVDCPLLQEILEQPWPPPPRETAAPGPPVPAAGPGARSRGAPLGGQGTAPGPPAPPGKPVAAATAALAAPPPPTPAKTPGRPADSDSDPDSKPPD
jgi:hypothetical protein